MAPCRDSYTSLCAITSPPPLPPPPVPPRPLPLSTPPSLPPTAAVISSVTGTISSSSPTVDSSAAHRRLVNIILIAISIFAALSLLSLTLSAIVRRRRIRRQLLTSPVFAVAVGPTSDVSTGDDQSDSDDFDGVHHVWYIRTVGLDDAAIESIAVMEYKSGGDGLLGVTDCSVCLGEFNDGELVRLLPKCGHAFHVPCIDTWLRAHVNCPLCRSDVVDPITDSIVAHSEPVNESQAVDLEESSEEEEEEEEEQAVVQVVVVDQFSSPESASPRPVQVTRRAASMDSVIIVADAVVARASSGCEEDKRHSLEAEQSGREKQGNASSKMASAASSDVGFVDIEGSLSGSGRRSFFSRHGRARSSVLPL